MRLSLLLSGLGLPGLGQPRLPPPYLCSLGGCHPALQHALCLRPLGRKQKGKRQGDRLRQTLSASGKRWQVGRAQPEAVCRTGRNPGRVGGRRGLLNGTDRSQPGHGKSVWPEGVSRPLQASVFPSANLFTELMFVECSLYGKVQYNFLL